MRQPEPNINNNASNKSLFEEPKYNIQKNPYVIKNSEKYMMLGKKHKNDRKNNSLEEITKNFIKYIKKSKSNKIEIKSAVKYLNIKKRRIYDITNVLEGKFIFITIYYIFLFKKELVSLKKKGKIR